jgi:signal transduction histidine kinase
MKSIRGRLALTIMSGFGSLLILCGLAVYFLTRAALLDEFDAGLRAKAQTIMSQAEQGKDGIQLDLADAIIGETNADLNSEFFQVWNTNGTVVTRSPSLRNADLPFRSGPPAKPVFWDLDLPGDRDGRAIGLRFRPNTEDEEAKRLPQVEAIIVVAADSESIDRTLGILEVVLAATGLLTIAITVPLVRFALRRGHAPLDELSRQAAAITAGSLQTRFPVDSMPEELIPITKRLNDLLGRLEESFERERRFSADLAHELRTPLAELRSLTEVELAWPEGGNPEKHRETLDIALQMEAMVNRLLELARSEDGKITLQLETIPLAGLVEDAWRPFAAKAKARQLIFLFDVPPEAKLETDRALFRSILSNLFSNAVDYTPEAGRVEIKWNPAGCELAISNTVHDLTPADLPHLFERLWRKDKSRTGGDHCGLGLVVSRSSAGLVGLDLKAEFTSEQTLCISLRPSSGIDESLFSSPPARQRFCPC